MLTAETKRRIQSARDILVGQLPLPTDQVELITIALTYDHSEELGNAFEFILESMGVQADNGQFRTPRHIIEFIVDVVDPQKDEKILDPACGTAGFLISAYKHILAANTSKTSVAAEVTRLKSKPGNNQSLLTSAATRKFGDLLTGAQRKKLTDNVVGYDITPLMCRLSRVNMYLHHFSNPVIHEYNTLANKNRWDDKFDVILANPPFMTPKGGIRPHDRFAISANRSEVLFVDYIAEHLNPAGRAGIIVPEGIIFQSQNAYKELRRMLVDGFLWAVVSLPAGVFNPYAGVKTSILLLDRALAKQNGEVLFVKVENDGFGLGAQRREIEQNDLPAALRALQEWKQPRINTDKHGSKKEIRVHPCPSVVQTLPVSRKRILESPDISLSGDRYRAVAVRGNGKFPMVELGEVITLQRGYDLPKQVWRDGPHPIVGSNGIIGHHAEWKENGPGVVTGRSGTIGKVNLIEAAHYWPHNTSLFVKDFKGNEPKFVKLLLEAIDLKSLGAQTAAVPSLDRKNAHRVKVPLPPLDVQKEIVAEIEGYRRVIEPARQILAHYKPTLRLNLAWPMISVGDVLEDVKYTTKVQKSEFLEQGKFPIVDQSQNGIAGYWNDAAAVFHISKPVVLFGDHTRALKYVDFDFVLGADGVKILQPDKRFVPKFFHLALMNAEIPELGYSRHFKELVRVQIPIPPLAEQRALVAELEAERALVEANRELAERFEQKLQTKLSEIWGAPSAQK